MYKQFRIHTRKYYGVGKNFPIAAILWGHGMDSCLDNKCLSGPEPAILDWYGHCGVNKLGGSGGMLPQENF